MDNPRKRFAADELLRFATTIDQVLGDACRVMAELGQLREG